MKNLLKEMTLVYSIYDAILEHFVVVLDLDEGGHQCENVDIAFLELLTTCKGREKMVP